METLGWGHAPCHSAFLSPVQMTRHLRILTRDILGTVDGPRRQ